MRDNIVVCIYFKTESRLFRIITAWHCDGVIRYGSATAAHHDKEFEEEAEGEDDGALGPR